MSAYKKIKSELKNPESLIKALRDLGYVPEVSLDPHRNTMHLIGYHGDVRPETAAIRVPREQVGRASNDVGFAWNGTSYDSIISEFDSHATFTTEKVNALKQRYTLHEVKRIASLQGYSLMEKNMPDGTIQLVCTSGY